jgi:5-formyltetrahydrofolate cyclo-ligase
MHFAAIRRDTQLVPDFYGIPEPADPELIDPRSLDLVLTPLVGFDSRGNRIGVGAGYYDRCFSFLRQRRHWHQPKLIGTAYSLQQIDAYEPNDWDVPLWGVVTETGFVRFQ